MPNVVAAALAVGVVFPAVPEQHRVGIRLDPLGLGKLRALLR